MNKGRNQNITNNFMQKLLKPKLHTLFAEVIMFTGIHLHVNINCQ